MQAIDRMQLINGPITNNHSRIAMSSDIIRQKKRHWNQKYFVDKEWFTKAYLVDMLPTREIAREIGCCNEHVNSLAISFGIPVRPRQPRSIPHKKIVSFDDEELKRLYLEKEWSCHKIGQKYGCTSKPVYARLRELGVKIRHHNDTKRGRPPSNKINIDASEVRNMYEQDYVSSQDIADHFGVSIQVICRIRKENGIATKPIIKSVDRRKEKSPRWKPELSDEDRLRARDALKQGEWRSSVFSRDGYKCLKCFDAAGGNLNAHHITPYSVDRSIAWDLSNGATLCKRCHMDFHGLYGYTQCTKRDFEEYIGGRNGGC